MKKIQMFAFVMSALAAPTMVSHADAVVRSASGATAASIQPAVTQFQSDISLGGPFRAATQPPATDVFTTGGRTINWDTVPAGVFDPNALPASFFSTTSRRGFNMTTAGTSLLVSTPALLGSSGNFTAFSLDRIFTVRGSTVVDGTFNVPTSPTTAATVNGFGVVFSDVEVANSTTIEYFDASGDSLGIFAAPVGPNAGFSFLGVSFDDGERVSRVRITSGNAPLGTPEGTGVDVVVMDDFIYSEPLADDDSDGVPTAFDQCAGTATGDPVNAQGCSIAQLVRCDASWKNHGAYVSAVSKLAEEFVVDGVITEEAAEAIVSDAARSNCGKKSAR